MSDHRTIQGLLKRGELSGLVKQVLKAHEVNQVLQPLLNPEHQGQCQVTHVEGGCVTLDVPNASLLTVMRYQAPELLSKLRMNKALAGLTSIKCRIKPPAQAKKVAEPPKPSLFIDEASRAVLKETAEKIEDERLRAALLKLASD